MKIEEIISEEIIDLDLTVDTKLDAINHLIDLLYNAGRISTKDEFLKQVLGREKTEPTDFGIGIAIPHGRSDVVNQTSVAIGKINTPLTWNATQESDEPLIFAVFLMASTTSDEGKSHLEVIANIATLLIEEDFVEFLKNVSSATSLIKMIKTCLGEE